MKIPRILTYTVGLIILAFALGSLPRGTPGGSLLFRAYWLLYLFYIIPVLIVGALVAVTVLIALNYRDIGAAIGFKMSRQRRMRKRGSRYNIAIQLLFWGSAVVLLAETKGSILNPTRATNSTLAKNVIGENATAPKVFQTGDLIPALSNLVQNTWFSIAFLGLLVVGGVIIIQGVRVSLKDTRDLRIQELLGKQEEGLQAVNEAIRLIEDPATDPRRRIIACYQHLITTVSRLGAPISPDLTARELDRAVRSTFALKGPATSDLTQIFEEARYSLHEIGNSDAERAHEYLESVAEELKIQLRTDN